MCSGKARRGDGNDLTANPKKLAAIGKELDKLNKEINLMTPVSEVPLTTRSVTPGIIGHNISKLFGLHVT